MKEFNVVRAKNISQLTYEINSMLRTGWELHGTIFKITEDEFGHCMVKEDDYSETYDGISLETFLRDPLKCIHNELKGREDYYAEKFLPKGEYDSIYEHDTLLVLKFHNVIINDEVDDGIVKMVLSFDYSSCCDRFYECEKRNESIIIEEGPYGENLNVIKTALEALSGQKYKIKADKADIIYDFTDLKI